MYIHTFYFNYNFILAIREFNMGWFKAFRLSSVEIIWDLLISGIFLNINTI